MKDFQETNKLSNIDKLGLKVVQNRVIADSQPDNAYINLCEFK